MMESEEMEKRQEELERLLDALRQGELQGREVTLAVQGRVKGEPDGKYDHE